MIIIAAIVGLILTMGIVGLAVYIVIARKAPVLRVISEVILLVGLPIFGFLESNDPCQEHPFELNSYTTAVALYLLPLICYFLSSYLKKNLPPFVLAILPIGIVIGLVYCLTLQIHFGAHVVLVLFPVIGLPLITPIIAFLFLLKEFIALHNYQREQIGKQSFSSPILASLSNLFLLPFWIKTPIALLLAAPILALLQFILTLAGQAPDSMISMFTESCGFLLSNHSSCGCGGDHYLCSIAANGNKKLVKPVRFGIRQNEKILVNRQLLIANAFENWMEEKTPRLHKVIRRTYDSMGIQVNKWSKKRRFANVLYVIMKPLEWLFLLWLYCFDKKPEDRIALQYLPKKMYENWQKDNLK